MIYAQTFLCFYIFSPKAGGFFVLQLRVPEKFYIDGSCVYFITTPQVKDLSLLSFSPILILSLHSLLSATSTVQNSLNQIRVKSIAYRSFPRIYYSTSF